MKTATVTVEWREGGMCREHGGPTVWRIGTLEDTGDGYREACGLAECLSSWVEIVSRRHPIEHAKETA